MSSVAHVFKHFQPRKPRPATFLGNTPIKAFFLVVMHLECVPVSEVEKSSDAGGSLNPRPLFLQPKSLQMQEAAPNFRGLCVPALMESLMAKWIVCPGIVPLINNLITSVDHNLAKQVNPEPVIPRFFPRSNTSSPPAKSHDILVESGAG